MKGEVGSTRCADDPHLAGAVIRDGSFCGQQPGSFGVFAVSLGESSRNFSPFCPAALSHGAVVSQVLAAGALRPVACRLTVNLRRAALPRGLWCRMPDLTPSLVDGVCTVVSPHTRPSVENENGITADGHAVNRCAIIPHSQHAPLTRSCWSGRRKCYQHLRRPLKGY
jgi:hypothetical protein